MKKILAAAAVMLLVFCLVFAGCKKKTGTGSASTTVGGTAAETATKKTVKEKADDAMETVSEKISDAMETVSDKISEAGSEIREGISDMTGTSADR